MICLLIKLFPVAFDIQNASIYSGTFGCVLP